VGTGLERTGRSVAQRFEISDRRLEMLCERHEIPSAIE